jgi:hypothetical protein
MDKVAAMNQRTNRVAWGLVIVLGLCMGCGDQVLQEGEATPTQPRTSPSGRYRLVVVGGHSGQQHFRQFEVMTNRPMPTVLYCSKDQFRTGYETLLFAWDTQDRVWVYSGDVGCFYWTRVKDDLWKKHAWVDEQISPPSLVKEQLKRIPRPATGKAPWDVPIRSQSESAPGGRMSPAPPSRGR